MSKDAQGNDLSAVEVPITGGIMLVEYSDDNVITSEMIGKNVTTPQLPKAYDRSTACVGLITSDGGPQDSRDADDATEFYQDGYLLAASATLTTSFTAAENNEMTRKVTLGEPDENGVYAVDDIVQDKKWMAYQEESLRGGRVRRRAGVVIVTGNEPNQSERGSVKGQQLTVTWQNDEHYQGKKYIECIYEPAND